MKKWIYSKIAHRLLWIVVIISLVASLPLIVQRWQAEQSAPGVEIVYDYSDLTFLAANEPNPQQYLEYQLTALRDAGVTTMAVGEKSLEQYAMEQELSLYSSKQAADVLNVVVSDDENYTYVTFKNEAVRQRIQPLIETQLSLLNVEMESFSLNNDNQAGQGIIIQEVLDHVAIMPLFPDLVEMEMLSDYGFHIAARMSDNRPFHFEVMEQAFIQLADVGVRWIIFSGDDVTGNTDEEERLTLQATAQWMKENGIGFALIETSKDKQQAGRAELANLLDYDVIRLHSILEKEMFLDPDILEDRIVLAVEDRNIRMIYLNGDSIERPDDQMFEDSMEHTLEVLLGSEGDNGAVARLEAAGYTLDTAQPFTFTPSSWNNILKLLVVLGAVAMISLTMGRGLRLPAVLFFVIGVIGSAGLYVLSVSLLYTLAALGTAICTPSYAVMYAMDKVKQMKQKQTMLSASGSAVILFLLATGITAIAFSQVSGILQGMTYMVLIDQFRGVSLLKLAPIAIIAIYAAMYASYSKEQQGLARLQQIAFMNIKVIYVVLAALFGGIVLYYLSRAGNAGQTLPLEQEFRSLLQHTFGVRPRTSEFLIGHPLFIFAAYVALKYRKGAELFVIGVFGQLSMVNTFTHLHTMLPVSMLRVTYGLILGIVIGFMIIIAFEVALRGWNKWNQIKKQY
ncbi:DUF5693 family protein [Longirhabdus pacifica]|uniref:DUF5693 family protein n=1 Tax=Longirhabdus pacifica TaxID=2305227 RepID=UPI001008EC23|nr:DUF5693 family protein [Longirhabdus pacifica]